MCSAFDGGGFTDRDTEFVAGRVGQRVVAFASVLLSEQHSDATLLLGMRQLGVVGRGELNSQRIRRRPGQSRYDDSCVSKNRHAEILGPKRSGPDQDDLEGRFPSPKGLAELCLQWTRSSEMLMADHCLAVKLLRAGPSVF